MYQPSRNSDGEELRHGLFVSCLFVKCKNLPYPQQYVNRQLIETLVGQTLLQDLVFVEVVRQQLRRTLFRIAAQLVGSAAGKFVEDFLYFLVGIPTPSFVFQDQVGSHAAAGEVFYSLIILGAVGVGVEVARTG